DRNLRGRAEHRDLARAAAGDDVGDPRDVALAASRVAARLAGKVDRCAAEPARDVACQARLEDPRVAGHPELARPSEGGPVEEMLDQRRAARRGRVAPDLGLAETAARRGVVDRGGLSEADDHPAGVALEPVVLRRGGVAEMLVAEAVAGAERRGQTVASPPRPRAQ